MKQFFVIILVALFLMTAFVVAAMPARPVVNSPDLYANSESGYFTLGQLARLAKVDPEAARFYVETVIDTLCTVSNSLGMDLLQLKSPLTQDADKVVRLTLERALAKTELYDKPAHQVVWFVVMTLSKPQA